MDNEVHGTAQSPSSVRSIPPVAAAAAVAAAAVAAGTATTAGGGAFVPARGAAIATAAAAAAAPSVRVAACGCGCACRGNRTAQLLARRAGLKKYRAKQGPEAHRSRRRRRRSRRHLYRTHGVIQDKGASRGMVSMGCRAAGHLHSRRHLRQGSRHVRRTRRLAGHSRRPDLHEKQAARTRSFYKITVICQGQRHEGHAALRFGRPPVAVTLATRVALTISAAAAAAAAAAIFVTAVPTPRRAVAAAAAAAAATYRISRCVSVKL